MQSIFQPEQEDIFSVSQFNGAARMLLEENFQMIWLIGEISNLSTPSSGHSYFSLKDQNAQVRCALFRLSRRNIDFDLENGQLVLVRAKVSLYEARGDFQLIISQMQLAGDGALQIAFEKLKNKLSAEGLFDEQAKQPIPELPQCIGIISSATGAALRDILKVLRRRFASIPVIIYPSMVQGDKAAAQLCHAIEIANQRQECDVLILARGGGSLEDLWCFNEESVARAIFASKIPIVSGIGHEVDFTIADFVADIRAATPSAAAELVSPDREEWLQYLLDTYQNLIIQIHQQIKNGQLHLQHLIKRLRHPGDRLREQTQRLDYLEQRLRTFMQHQLQRNQQQLQSLSRALDAVSPLQTLGRGYAILSNTASGKVITSITDVKPKDNITAKLNDGIIHCQVE